MIFFVTLLAFTMFSVSIISRSTENGLSSVVNRLGADIMVVPEEGGDSVQSLLFQGIPCTTYFDAGIEEKIKNVEGVEKTSPQLYLATLSASCCDSQLQLIAFDPKTDFVIQPWLKSSLHNNLSAGSVVVGSSVNKKAGDTITFYGIEFKVAGRMERTGMGYDSSVFLNFEDAQKILESPNIEKNKDLKQVDNIISTVVVDIGTNSISKVSDQIKKELSGNSVGVYTSETLTHSIAGSIANFKDLEKFTEAISFLSAAVALLSLFAITINERKKEFGILLSIGTRHKQIFQIIVTEATTITIFGAILGIVIGAITVFPFSIVISQKLALPYLLPELTEIAGLVIKILVISVSTGICSAIFATKRLLACDASELVKETE
ncbi:ABC transporter permease [Acetobacterium tundrae]|uniref:FtsX-like permease family protein n=1 Tax=Acetobacterium tundrae TaxID=132932 RepID=A0ABR6WGJ6_9FIRM|nr:FtsX-like permease family protein [Acetobacterium tundrae]MBC3795618.1 FtsX-like permease family protein [Acetobacterium tundrae]